jgi:hypothetical protein
MGGLWTNLETSVARTEERREARQVMGQILWVLGDLCQDLGFYLSMPGSHCGVLNRA